MVNLEHTVTAAQAADLLGVARHTVFRMVARGDLSPAFKAEGRTGLYLFARGDVEQLREQRTAGAR
jgi:excisionase family DNA binding protein